ncbi:helicase associated domain-containing protein [Streptomyces sp. NBC_00654]|uniref:helicase associated domain-containing protein n=1 Tax=Streptomyces sp. NBC_00654 TaxID=2975799 RepID=UPI00225725C2|nr:helicase associated domain-containing protein [Streptomyces sp. NBC_00654]MCX4967259.1 helicase associated domain-containing protein [Streptomyces sp. NBC_00654]
MLFEGDDLRKWLAQQRRARTWAQLTAEQQERLEWLGVTPDEPAPEPVKTHTASRSACLSA